MKIKTTLLAAIAGFAFIGTSQAVNVLVNASFELAAQGGSPGPTNHVGTLPDSWLMPNARPNLVRHDGAGPDGSDQYVDWTVPASGTGRYLSQQFTLAVDSTVVFGAYYSNRGTANAGNFAEIYDAANTTQLFASPDVTPVGVTNTAWTLSQSTGVFLAAGTYSYRTEFDDFSNTDAAFVDATPIPEPSALGLLALAGLGLIGRRRR